MKKDFKYYVIFVFMLLILGTTNVYAVSSMKVTEKSYIKTNFSDGTHRTEAYFNTNKGVAYCITPSKTGAPQGKTLTYSKTVSSGSVLYLLDNAGSSKSDYLITQLAIWKVNNNYLPAAYSKNSSLVSKVNKLANTAKNNSSYSPNPTMKLSNSSLSFTESSDGNYYISNSISITASDMDKIVATVSGANGAVVVSNQKTGTSLTITNKKFNIKVPKKNITANTTIKVTVKGTGNKLSYQRYSGGSWQDLVVLVKTPKTVSTIISGTIKPVVYKCQYTNGKYYDKDGNVTDKTTYSLQCEKHTCEKVGDTYFGKDGSQVTEKDYNLQCKTHTCEKVDNTYFGKNGDPVSEKDYNLQCKTHTCEKVDDKYFGKNGTEVSEKDYNLQCKTHTCEKVDDKYFGKNGTEVSEKDYNLQCKTHTCEKVDDTYFGKDGKEVSEKDYNLQCKTHTCEKVDDTYFGKDGSEVTEKDYNLQCKTHSCEQVDDKFFDKNGNEITESEFNLQCKTHTCEKVDDKYFDKNGNETDESTYKKQCEMTIEVPNTGSSDSLVFTVLGALTLAGTVLVIKKF